MTKHSDLVKELDEKFGHIFLMCTHHDEMLATFIEARERRIVEPIREAKEYRIKNGGSWVKGLRTNDAIDETLRRAGVE